MKKTVALSIISSLGLTSFLANAEMNEKNGFYVAGKIGTSITQISGQKISGSAEILDKKAYEEFDFGNHRKGVFGGGIALGYDFSNKFDLPIRAELDFTVRGKASSNNYIDRTINVTNTNQKPKVRGVLKNQVNLNTIMLNAYYDFKNESSFTPYVSAGLGYAMVKYKATLNGTANVYSTDLSGSESDSHTSNNFAWSLGVGVKYIINNDLNLDLSYRYLDAGKAKLSESVNEGLISGNIDSKVKVKTNDIMLGLTYNF